MLASLRVWTHPQPSNCYSTPVRHALCSYQPRAGVSTGAFQAFSRITCVGPAAGEQVAGGVVGIDGDLRAQLLGAELAAGVVGAGLAPAVAEATPGRSTSTISFRKHQAQRSS